MDEWIKHVSDEAGINTKFKSVFDKAGYVTNPDTTDNHTNAHIVESYPKELKDVLAKQKVL